MSDTSRNEAGAGSGTDDTADALRIAQRALAKADRHEQELETLHAQTATLEARTALLEGVVDAQELTYAY